MKTDEANLRWVCKNLYEASLLQRETRICSEDRGGRSPHKPTAFIKITTTLAGFVKT